MKKLVMTAAALTLGTSALAWAPAEEAHLAAIELARSQWNAEKSPLAFSSFDKSGMMKSENAALETSAAMPAGDELGMKSLAKWNEGASVQTASASSEAKVSTDGGMIFADADIKSKEDVGGIEAASAASGAKAATDGGMIFADADIKSKEDVGGIETASVESGVSADGSAATGMGGPIETATGWPACDPGPGDDRCIQLYERGVRPALAAWKATDDNVAMGGPFEPAQSNSKSAASEEIGQGADPHAGHDMSADAGQKTATAASEGATDGAEAAAKPAATGAPAATPGGIGGPIEQRSDYPPCRPGRGDDRCIQLYERGVSGRLD